MNALLDLYFEGADLNQSVWIRDDDARAVVDRELAVPAVRPVGVH